MNKEIKKIEDLYLVLKWEDIRKNLSFSERNALAELIRKVERGRKVLSCNKYIVCNQDEPYAEKVWQMILDGERAKLKGDGK
ncbi:MAG: hypothetical protein WC365_09350 [Candidatus Babeliales bacterium]|jgi:uncharacterized protein YhfF